MTIKINQLKKLNMKMLKKIVKDNKLGKITRKKKAQLIGMISNCDNCKVILSTLTLPVKKKRIASPAQLKARAKFKIMAQNKSKTISELKDLILDKGLKVPDTLDKNILLKTLTEGKLIAKSRAQDDIIKVDKVVIPIKKKVKKVRKIKPRVGELLNKVKEMEKIVEKIKDKPISVVRKIGKKAFLDGIFGPSVFNLVREIDDLLEEASDSQVEIFLGMNKKKRTELLQKRFNSSKSLGQLIKQLNKKE